MEKIDIWWTLILFTIVSISMTLIFISTVAAYYKRKQELQQDKIKILEISEKKYRSLVESMDDTVLVIGKNHDVLLFNNQIDNAITTDQLVKESVKLGSIFPEEFSSVLRDYFIEVFETRKPVKTEVIYQRDNDKKWLDASFLPQYDEAANIKSVLCILHDLTKRKNLEIELQQAISTLNSQKRMLENLSSEVIRAQEDERKRISRDLHDEIGQTLTAISFNLEYLNHIGLGSEADAADKLNDIKKLVTKSIQDVHRFSHDLRPAVLDDLGFETAIRSHARKFADRTGININFKNISIGKDIEDNKQIVLYRIFQEGLNNIAKHSRAGNVLIDLSLKDDSVVMYLSDDGVGFNISSLDNETSGKGGLGLKGMKERVKQIGGKLNLISKPDQGTTIYVEAPIN
ncbi:MAG: PAS domain-containing sensor histidine kinase [Candidatus Neomarinimicrobiota bacterium]